MKGLVFIDQIQEWFKDTTRADAGNLRELCQAFPGGVAAGDVEPGEWEIWRNDNKSKRITEGNAAQRMQANCAAFLS